ncbi:MAG: ABC transporter permease [Ignavibacteriales bacterium]|nr:MAG: ABC transporter permease [Ignavibacteriales bacterium]
MNLESFIAKRYLVSKHKINFITIISMLSVAGITIGVAALIVVLSVFNGFGSLVQSFLINFDPHIRIETLTSDSSIKNSTENLFEDNSDITGFTPFVNGKVLVYRAGLTQIVTLKGIEESASKSIYGIEKSIIFGDYVLETDEGTDGIVIGIRLADKLQALVGDTLTFVSPVGIEKSIIQFSMPQMHRFVIRGIFNSNNNDYDLTNVYCSLKSGQRLLGYKNNIQGYELRLSNLEKSSEVKKELQNQFTPDKYLISTWYDLHKDLYSVMQIERWAAYIILSLIIAVATFNILGSLSMSVIEKKRDIGILRSMGVNEKSIIKIFMYEGILVGILGTLAGVVIGYFVLFLQINYNIYPLDPTQYKIDSLPVELRFADFFFVTGAAMLLSFFASLYPAKRAAKLNMIESIKWE